MEIKGEGIDSILIQLYPELLTNSSPVSATRGKTFELLAVSLQISNPRARISRSENRGKPFSALGELLWYLSANDSVEFILPYVPMYECEAEFSRIHGAYGPRLFCMRNSVNQIESVIHLLTEYPTTRRAVIQLFNAEDITSRHRDVPCTTTLQFFVRESQLHLFATLRSNDAYWGLPHDVFCFTMLQEIMACRLNLDLGTYFQFVGSMHIYEPKCEAVRNYIDEGHHRVEEMPKMPTGDPTCAIRTILDAEAEIRHGNEITPTTVTQDEYWVDLVRLLQLFWALRRDEPAEAIVAAFHHPVYRTLLGERLVNRQPRSVNSQRNDPPLRS